MNPEDEIVGPREPAAIRSSFVRIWSSPGLAVALIGAIAGASVLGTIVPQGPPSKVFGLAGVPDWVKTALIALTAHDVFYSLWFLGLVACFFLNLAVCTYARFGARLGLAFDPPPDLPEAVRGTLPEQRSLTGVGVGQVAAELRAAGFRGRALPDGGWAGDKRRWTRLGPPVVHLGLFLILGAAVVAGLTGFKHSFSLRPGEEMRARTAFLESRARGVLAAHPPDFAVRLDRFWTTFYDDGSVKQYHSALSIVEDGSVKARATIRVGEPLVYKGIYVYQSSWGVAGAWLAADGARARLVPLAGRAEIRFGMRGASSGAVALGGRRVHLVHPDAPGAPLVVLDAGSGGAVARLAPGETARIGRASVRYAGPSHYSGFETKSDPGIPLMYLGFLVVVAGTLMAAGSHTQVWVSPETGGCRLAARSNRGRYMLGREISRLCLRLAQARPAGADPGEIPETLSVR